MTDRATYRQIIEAYRLALKDHAPKVCDDVDYAMKQAGHEWVCDDLIVNIEELMSAPEIARRFGVNRYDVHNWAKQGGIKRYGSGRNLKYRLGDILLFESLKGRKGVKA